MITDVYVVRTTKEIWSEKNYGHKIDAQPLLLIILTGLFVAEVGQVDWSKLPDVVAVVLLTWAFASVARRGQSSVSGLWLVGWLMIVLHFTAYMFMPSAGSSGAVADFVALSALASAGILFMWAAVPFRMERSSRWMVGAIVAGNTLYLGAAIFASHSFWALTASAVLLGALPLAVALVSVRDVNRLQRWATVALYCALSILVLTLQYRPGDGLNLAVDALFCNIFLDCGIHFWYAYRRATAGACITIFGFFGWAGVFVTAPMLALYLPDLRVQDEVWNLPKYVVAVGMILLLLEDQIEHNKYLALHDELTGLPNRRLFQDRLASALERARRTGTQVALMLVDLDHFKQVNDTFGHPTGDSVLKRVGAILSGRVRRSDTVARTGGDEFSIVLEEPASRADAERVCRSLMQLLDAPLDLDNCKVKVGASVGLAIYPDDAGDMEALCVVADVQMYSAKHLSRRSGKTILSLQ